MQKYFVRRREQYYNKNHWHTHLDLTLLAIVVMMAILAVTMATWKPDWSNILNNSAWQKIIQQKQQPLNEAKLHLTVTPLTKIMSSEADKIVKYKIDYQNLEGSGLTKVQFKLINQNSDFNLGLWHLNTSTRDWEVQDNNLIARAVILPNATGTIIIQAPFSRVNFSANNSLKLAIEASYETNGQNLSLTTEAPAIKFGTDLKVQAVAYYYSPQGDQLGVGPIPPMVNQATAYYIALAITNTGNAVDEVKVRADLTNDGMMNGVKSVLAGELNYNYDANRVTWSINNLPAETVGTNYRAGFSVALVPTEAELDRVIYILKNITYTAHDKVTDEIISGQLPNLDTNLIHDLMAQGQGRVVRGE